MRSITSLLTLIALVSVASPALAVSRHERVDIKPIKKGKEVIGMQIEMTLRAEGAHQVARVGIGPGTMSSTESFQRGGSGRNKASEKSAGYLLHQFDEVKVKAGEPKKMTLKVLYKDTPNLKPGQKIELITAFNQASYADYWHVYGLKALGGERLYDAPGTAAKRFAATSRLKRGSRTKARASRRPTQQRNKAKAKAKPRPRAKARGR